MHNNNNNNGRHKKGANKKQQLSQLFKPRAKPKPGWDDSINDLTVHKLSKDEVEARRKSYQSNNADVAKTELYERKPSPQLPSFFQHLDAQIEDLIHGRTNGKNNAYMGGYENAEDDNVDHYNHEDAMGPHYQHEPNGSRFSVVPDVTYAPNSRKPEVHATPHVNKVHPNQRSAAVPQQDQDEEEDEEESDLEDDNEQGVPTASDPCITPKQQPRSMLRPTPMPGNTPSPLTYNTPPIDAKNVMWFYDNPNEPHPTENGQPAGIHLHHNRPTSAHLESRNGVGGGKPALKKETSANSVQSGNRPNSAGSRFNTSGRSIDLEEEIENFKKANANNKNRPNSAKGRSTASKPPLRPSHSFQNTSSDNLANLNNSFTNNLSLNSAIKTNTNTLHNNNTQNGHNFPQNKPLRSSDYDSLDAARELSFQVDQFEKLRMNGDPHASDPNERKQFPQASATSPMVGDISKFIQQFAEYEEQRKENAQQKALLWEAVQNQITKISELEQTVNSLRREKDDLQHYFMAFQQVTSEKFILVQKVLAQYVRSAELDRLGQQPTVHSQPSHPQTAQSHQQPLPHPHHPTATPHHPSSSLPAHLSHPQSQPTKPPLPSQYPTQSHEQFHQQPPQPPQHQPHHPQPPNPRQPSHQPLQHPPNQHAQKSPQDENYYTFFNPNNQSQPPTPPSNSTQPPPQYERDTTDYNEYSKALLERQRKFLTSPQSQRSSFLNQIPQLPKGTSTEGFGSTIKDVEVIEGPRKVPTALQAQKNPTHPYV